MIIIMDPEKNHIGLGSKMARQYDEQNVLWRNDISFANESRLSFLGHASTEAFGEQSVEPKDFAEFLMQHGLETDKPVKIDLLGCEIGYCGPEMQAESYAHKVYQELQENGYTNVTVNAFINFVNRETLVNQRLTSVQCANYDDVYFFFNAIRKEDETRMENDPQMLALKEQEEKINAEIKMKNARLATEHEKIIADTASMLEVEPLADLLTTYTFNQGNTELRKIHREKEDVMRKYRTEFCMTTDPRRTFDENIKYQINSVTYNDPGLSIPSRMVIIALSDRIAELKSELHDIHDSRFDYFIWGGDTKKMKINRLQEVIAEVRNAANENELIQVIDKALKDKQLATSNTKMALEGIREELGKMRQAESNRCR